MNSRLKKWRVARRVTFLAWLGFATLAESSAPLTNAPLEQIAPNVFQLGSVRLNKEKRTLQFPATVNMTNGLVEYFLVTETGKLHESVLKTETAPSQIHLAMLLLGAEVSNASPTNLAGDKFIIEVHWKSGTAEKTLRAEDLIFDSKTKSPMSEKGWIYTGSKVMGGTFIAQRDGSVVSIIEDSFAMANVLQTDRVNDEIWFVNTNAIPSLNTKVEVTFKLEWPPKITNDTK